MQQPNGILAAQAGYTLPLQVLSSVRGYYIGTQCRCPVNPWSITETMSRRHRRWKAAPGRSGRVREDEEGIWRHAVLIR